MKNVIITLVFIYKTLATLTLVPGSPGPVTGCKVLNTTTQLLHVLCSAGDNGGLPQTFHMEIYDRQTRTLRANISIKTDPIFIVNDLPPNLSYTLVVYAANAKGKSDLTSITAQISGKEPSSGMNFKKGMDIFLWL